MMTRLFFTLLMTCALFWAAPVSAEGDADAQKKTDKKDRPTILEQPDTRALLCPQLYDEDAYDKIDKKQYSFIIPGLNGWVFRTQTDLKKDFKVGEETLKQLNKLSKALKSRGTDLVIAIVPSKSMAHGDQFDKNIGITRGFIPPIVTRDYYDRIRDMNAAGILTVGASSLNPPEGNFFYKLDHHWSKDGAELMAKDIAAFIRQEIRTYDDIPEVKFETKIIAPKDFVGTYNTVVEPICGNKLPSEIAYDIETAPIATDTNEDDLFGTQKQPEIVLVGTSFSSQEISFSNFEGYLKQHLSRDVVNKSIPGGGFETSLLAYIASKEFKQDPPKILIWEFPVYYYLYDAILARLVGKQGVPSMVGDCPGNAIKETEVTLQSPMTDVFNDLGLKDEGQYYLTLNFTQNVFHNFRIVTHTEDKETDTFRIRRNKRWPENTPFFMAFEDNKSPLQSVSIKPHDKMAGMKMTARICKTPQEK